MRRCKFAFKHPQRPRERCNLPVDHHSRELCYWHIDRRTNGQDIGLQLCAAVSKSDHWLEGANLEGCSLADLDLIGAKLPWGNLADSNLSGVSLDVSLLEGACLLSCNMSRASFIGARLAGAILNGANAENAHLQGIDLSSAHLEGLCVSGAYLQGFRFTDETRSYGLEVGMPGEMIEGDYQTASTVFRELSRHFRSVSNHQRAEEFYFLQMTAIHLLMINATACPLGSAFQRLKIWRSALGRCNPFRQWLPWALHRWVWGYGSRPLQTLVWMLGVILCFGLVVFPMVGVVVGDTLSRNVWQCLTESLVSFTSLGSGARLPNGLLGETLSGLEALLGVVLSSLFIVALATRYVHRP